MVMSGEKRERHLGPDDPTENGSFAMFEMHDGICSGSLSKLELPSVLWSPAGIECSSHRKLFSFNFLFCLGYSGIFLFSMLVSSKTVTHLALDFCMHVRV